MTKSTLEAFPVQVELPVIWGQMDAFQHVNNTEYFRFFETGRIAYFERMNMDEIMRELGVGPILAATNCSFRIPLVYPDTVAIGTRTSQLELEKNRLLMEYSVVSRQHDKVAAIGMGTIVAFNYQTKQRADIPSEWLDAVASIEGKSIEALQR